jgi:hypothetical protein
MAGKSRGFWRKHHEMYEIDHCKGSGLLQTIAGLIVKIIGRKFPGKWMDCPLLILDVTWLHDFPVAIFLYRRQFNRIPLVHRFFWIKVI